MSPRLVVLSGPLQGRLIELAGARLTIGRHSGNDLQLREIAVSRQHCVIERRGTASYWLRDLDSRHGTFVDGVPIKERELGEGSLVTLGPVTFLFLLRPPSSGEGPEGGPRGETTLQLAATESLYLQPEKLLAGLPEGVRLGRALQVLLQLAASLGAVQSLAELERVVLERVFEAVPVELAGLLLVDEVSDELAPALALDRRGEQVEPPAVDRTVARRAVAEGVAVVIAESAEISRLYVPLLASGQGVGILAATTSSQVTLGEEQVQLLTAIATLAAPALTHVRRREWLAAEQRRLEAAGLAHAMVGESPALRRIEALIARVAPTDSTVLITGESGTGKELAAQALHRNSPRAEKPFVAVNCATLSENLLESELFGHERGAFTGAVATKAGKLEVADGGTLFLDEVGELPLVLQAKLLRVLQERQFERVGSTRPRSVDLRLVAATNRDLRQRVREGAFREDLYYRLNVITLVMPPLRERREDVPLLASYFAAHHSRRMKRPVMGISPAARERLERYPWPGNVRELANAIERAVVLGSDDLIRPEDLPEAVLEAAAGAAPGAVPARAQVATHGYHAALNEHKKEILRTALAAAGGNVTRAAVELDLHPNYLHRLLSNLGLRGRS